MAAVPRRQVTVLVSSADAGVTVRLVRALGGTLVAAGGKPAAGRLALELGRVTLDPAAADLGASDPDASAAPDSVAGGPTLCLLGCRRDDPLDLLAQAVAPGVLGHLLVVGPGPVPPVALELLSTLPTVVALIGRAGEKAVRTALRADDVPLLRCDLDDRGSVGAVLESLLQRAYDARLAPAPC